MADKDTNTSNRGFAAMDDDKQREIARMLKLPKDKVRSRSSLVGGGFGGQEDMSVQHHAALMAWATGLPV